MDGPGDSSLQVQREFRKREVTTDLCHRFSGADFTRNDDGGRHGHEYSGQGDEKHGCADLRAGRQSDVQNSRTQPGAKSVGAVYPTIQAVWHSEVLENNVKSHQPNETSTVYSTIQKPSAWRAGCDVEALQSFLWGKSSQTGYK